MPEQQPAQQLREMINGYRMTQMLYVAAQLGLADLLSRGAHSAGELALATHTQPGALYRLLRALASLGVYAEDEQGRFVNTPLSELLRGDAPGSLRAEAVFAGHPPPWAAWGELLYSVQTGESAFKHHFGMSVWEYRAQNPDANAIANEYYTTVSLGQTAAIVAAYDFSGIRTLMDVAGGQGALIAAVLKAHSSLRGILFDQPHVVSGARALMEQAGVAERCEIIGGDFLGALPQGADACMLKNIIHDWGDADATAILRSCRRALPEAGQRAFTLGATPSPGQRPVPGHSPLRRRVGGGKQPTAGRLLVIDGVIVPGNDPHPRKLMDVQMLSVAGGRERTESEWRALLAGAGFSLSRVIETTAGISIIESMPAA